MRLRSSELSARVLGDETIVLHLTSSRYLSITGVGSRLFELLNEDRTVDELVSTILDEYEVDPVVARRDVDGFIADLRAAELLQ
jgi:coenzyme PQQ synthesis protein D (PqqD)